MTATHIPVLAGELIELTDPQPGAVAVDCTFGGGDMRAWSPTGSAQRGTLIGDRPRPGRAGGFAEFDGRGACADPVRARPTSPPRCATLADEGVQADLVYLDLGMSSMQVDTWSRGFSYAYDAPLDMRMDPDQELSAAEIVNSGTSAAGAPVARLRRGALRAADRTRDRRARERRSPLTSHAAARRRDQVRRAGSGSVRRRSSCRGALPGAADRRQR